MKRRQPMKLTAHPNVADLAEERRLREERRAAETAVRYDMCVPLGFVPMFIGFRAQEPEAAPPKHQFVPQLTAQGINELLQSPDMAEHVKRYAGVAENAPSPSHPAAQALLAGLMQGMGEREKDQALIDAGRRLAEAAQNGQQAAPERRWRPRWLRAVLRWVRRSRRL
jgi:hypothetical protein